jgi:hypothetical protein
MDQHRILPTYTKEKIPHLLSYPVGAKAISEALMGVPQFDELSVGFFFGNRLRRHHGTPFSLLDAGYSGPIRNIFTPKVREPYLARRWTISVYAVPQPLRHLIQSKLVNEALPSVRSWLLANPHSSNREGSHSLSFSFDELKNELKSEKHASLQSQTIRADGPR